MSAVNRSLLSRVKRGFSVLLICGALQACGEGSEPTEPSTPTTEESTPVAAAETPEETPPEAPVEPVADMMRGHFTHAHDARSAIISGDGEAARAAMDALANPGEDAPEFPPSVNAHLVAMREQASTFGEASTLAESGQAFSRVLLNCGACHSAIDGGPEFAVPPMPSGEGGEGVATRMRLHRWAADRMWEGLLTQNSETFLSGANALSGDPLRAEDLPEGDLDPARIQALADHVHTLGQEASEATTEEQRADIYGRFLATCTACHRALGVGERVREVTR